MKRVHRKHWLRVFVLILCACVFFASGSFVYAAENCIGNRMTDVPEQEDEDDEVIVTFDGNGGTVSETTRTVKVGSPYGPMPYVEQTGYYMSGWYTEPDGGEQIYESTIVTNTEDHTLYANWSPKDIIVEVYYGFPNATHATGHFEIPDTYETYYGCPYDFLHMYRDKKGYIPDGWYTQNGEKITTETKITIPYDHYVKFHWIPKKLKVTFNANGGTVSTKNKTVEFDSEYGVLPVPVRNGYIFVGWYTDLNGGFAVGEKTKVELDEDHTLYANWIKGNASTNTVNFVKRLYRLCLNREADANGLNDWVTWLSTGRFTAAQVVQGFFLSEEMKLLSLNDHEFVRRCYTVMMDREFDYAGLQYWVDMMNTGVSKNYILRGFVHSEEFTKLCTAYGIKRGDITLTEARDKNLGITRFISRCYTEVLEREAEPAGLNDWCGRILRAWNQKQTAINIASNGFFHSREYLNKNTSDDQYVRTLYRTFLGREAEEAGYNDWMNRLKSGVSRDTVLMGFAYSPEFAIIMQSYGIR